MIYLDNNATTRPAPSVVEAMLPYLRGEFANASSRHAMGERAADAVELARASVASLIAATPAEITFTSGATEACNLAIKGYARQRRHDLRIITCATEHRAVLDPCRRLAREGADVVELPVSSAGLIDLQQLSALIDPARTLVSIMAANNETGVLQPIRELGAMCAARGAVLHCDATQMAGKLPVNVEELGVHMLSLSAHKFHGPKGVGALFVRRRGARLRLLPEIEGGGHEGGLRSGTLNVPGIAGMGEAARLALASLADAPRTAALRDQLETLLRDALDEWHNNGAGAPRLPNTLNASFGYVDGNALIDGLDGLCVSSGSACSSASPEPSHVLAAMGVPEELIRASVRFSLSGDTTAEEIAEAARIVIARVRHLRGLSPLYAMKDR